MHNLAHSPMDSIMLALVLGFIFLLLSYTLSSKLAGKKAGLQLPPGPPRWPIVGNLFQLGLFPHKDFADFCSTHGPLVYLRLGKVGAITTDNPDVIREILLRQDDLFASRPRTLASTHLAYDGRDVALAPLGPHWKWMRRICMEHLLTAKQLESFAGHRAQEAQYLVRGVLGRAGDGKPVNLKEVLGAFSMNNVTRMLLGKQYFNHGAAKDQEAAEFLAIIHELFLLLGLIYIGDYLPFWRWIDPFGCEKKMREIEEKVDGFHQKIIEEHREAREERICNGVGGGDNDKGEMDFVDVLLSLPGKEGKEHMDDLEIKALMQDMIAAGTDTSAVTNEWAMAEIINHPRVLRKLQAELDTVIGRDRMVQESDLPNLPYLRCTVRETFRLHPAAPFLVPHESLRATTLMNYHIPAGTCVFINTYALGRNVHVWTDVDEFRPERHVQEDGKRVEISHGTDFTILPFGAGRRQCPGAPMGVVMVLMALARLLHCFDWEAPEGEVIGMEEVYGTTMPKAKPLMAVATPRLAAHLYG